MPPTIRVKGGNLELRIALKVNNTSSEPIEEHFRQVW